ncbi:EcsC family protein [Geminocystis sp. GBBB08]|uniref:EcsC family protein n=1 Tax=Geminocystis sp. GBBB08 TaxID=2604140 RepID=UPI0027E22CEA|nr:EcsC family protein [Geminocystis sp. GBBB08]MBL1209422.1 hypothetical protein [Geminocystis sp. GBBB08]
MKINEVIQKQTSDQENLANLILIIKKDCELKDIQSDLIKEKDILNLNLIIKKNELNQQIINNIVSKIKDFNLKDCTLLKIKIKNLETNNYDFHSEIKLVDCTIKETGIVETKTPKTFFSGWSNKIKNEANKIMTDTISEGNKTVLQVSNETRKIITDKIVETSQIIIQNTTEATGIISTTTSDVGKKLTETTCKMGETLTTTANETTKKINETAEGINKTFTETTQKVFQELDKATEFIANSPLLTKVIEQIDLEKAEEALIALKTKYPEDSPNQIAQKLMQQKAIFAGGTGFASSMLPGAAMAFLALDLAAVAALQAEMLFQIAGAYGMNLKAPQRKKEILTIFGIALGGTHAASAGLNILRTTPALGAVIGASSNVAMTYAIGYSACRFYENLILNGNNTQNLIASALESDLFLEGAISQEKIMDQILFFFILAENSHKNWTEIESQLNILNFSSESISNLKEVNISETNLDNLLDKIDPNFILPLYSQCEKILETNGENINYTQLEIINKIKEKITLNTSNINN